MLPSTSRLLGRLRAAGAAAAAGRRASTHVATAPPPARPRILITGAGLVSPLGPSLPATLAALEVAGATGVRAAVASDLAGWEEGRRHKGMRVATVPTSTTSPPFALPTPGAGRCAARFAELAGQAAAEALTTAGFPMRPGEGGKEEEGETAATLRQATGVAVGCGLAGLAELAAAGAAGRSPRLSPYFVPRVLPAMAAGHVSIGAGLGGPTATPVGGGSAGTDALGVALALLRAGGAAAMVAGGCEAGVGGVALAGLANGGAGGLALGEGAGMLLLEVAAGGGAPSPSSPPSSSSSSARRRPLAALLGYGSSSIAGWRGGGGGVVVGGGGGGGVGGEGGGVGGAVPVLPGSPPGPAWAEDEEGKEGGGGAPLFRLSSPLASAVAAAAGTALADARVPASSVGALITGTGGDEEMAGLAAALGGASVPAWCAAPSLGAGLAAGGPAGVALAAAVLSGRSPPPAWWPGTGGAGGPLVLVCSPCPLGGTVACVVVGPAESEE